MAQRNEVLNDRYRLIEPVARGGFGQVWRARDEVLQADVALKELLVGGSAPDPELVERAFREARNAARLRHRAGIVAIHDLFEKDGLPWIVMQFVDGCSLAQRLEAQGPLPVHEVTSMAITLLKALAAAHQAEVAHRDVKPANVLLSPEGEVFLGDFGIAIHSADTSLTTTGHMIGSPEYMAPERMRPMSGIPYAGDLFSLGATLYHAVEGISPFRRDDPDETKRAVLNAEFAPPQQVTGTLAAVITRLLARKPADRPDIAEALELLADLDSHPGREPAREGDWKRKGALVLFAMATGIALYAVAKYPVGPAGMWQVLEHGLGPSTAVNGFFMILIYLIYLVTIGLAATVMAMRAVGRAVHRSSASRSKAVTALRTATAGLIAGTITAGVFSYSVLGIADMHGSGTGWSLLTGRVVIAIAVVMVATWTGALSGPAQRRGRVTRAAGSPTALPRTRRETP